MTLLALTLAFSAVAAAAPAFTCYVNPQGSILSAAFSSAKVYVVPQAPFSVYSAADCVAQCSSTTPAMPPQINYASQMQLGNRTQCICLVAFSPNTANFVPSSNPATDCAPCQFAVSATFNASTSLIGNCGSFNSLNKVTSLALIPVNPLSQVLSVPCKNNQIVSLEVLEAVYTVPGIVNFNSRLYHYNGAPMFPAPTIRMQAGESCTIRVINKLSTTSSVSTCDYHSNTLHCPDTTNIHTHGLHVSPLEDNINTTVLPGYYLDYTYTIPNNHLPGTFWYHAHKHGSVALQVSGGMAGMLIVEQASNYVLPVDIDALYNAAYPLELFFHHVNFISGPLPNMASTDPFYIMDHSDISNMFSNQTILPNVQWLDTTVAQSFYTVNGQYQPTISVIAGSASLLRMVHAGMGVTFELELIDPNKYCNLTLLARDGIFQFTPYITLSAMVFATGTRADVAIICSTAGIGSTIVVQAYPNPTRSHLLGGENRFTQPNVFSIQINAGPAVPTTIITSVAAITTTIATLNATSTIAPTTTQAVLTTTNVASTDIIIVATSDSYSTVMATATIAARDSSKPSPPNTNCTSWFKGPFAVPTSAVVFPEYIQDLTDEPLSIGSNNVDIIQLTSGLLVETINNNGFPGYGPDLNDSQRYIEEFELGNTYLLYLSIPPPPGFPNVTDFTGVPQGPPFKIPGCPIVPPYCPTLTPPPNQPACPTPSNACPAPPKAPPGGPGVHPYHQHINAFQVMSVNPNPGFGDGSVIRQGEYRDVVWTTSNISIRFKPVDFTGEMVLHCHILQHEDMGMMGLFKLNGNNTYRTTTTGIAKPISQLPYF
ncbi:hypothetical protein HK100_002792 [Physocladia obscura]|uniref:Multicopper oxidase n=1 Tax=Physocladia obscura TaxID=109957 RepID=A0AAD5XAU5_9FUNG|nr:hypothetical protein HK100_002792 [Physocladia obscura]